MAYGLFKNQHSILLYNFAEFNNVTANISCRTLAVGYSTGFSRSAGQEVPPFFITQDLSSSRSMYSLPIHTPAIFLYGICGF